MIRSHQSRFRPIHVARHFVKSALWKGGLTRIAVLSDLHACDRWMPLSRIGAIVDQVNAESPDLILLPGDFLVGHLLGKQPVNADQIASVLAGLRAPLGVFASLGNHDWADCPSVRNGSAQVCSIVAAFERVGIRVLINAYQELANGAFLVGLDSSIGRGTTMRPENRHDPHAAFKGVPDDASTILIAHEPDIFLDQDRPVALQVSGHTHGGQIGPLGVWATFPSRYGNRLGYGLKKSGERNLVVTSGVGFGGVPIRLGARSEFAMVSLCAAQTRAASATEEAALAKAV